MPHHPNIDPQQLQKLVNVGATCAEIAAFFKCSERLIRKRFAKQIRQANVARRLRLRKRMDDLAREGNTSVLILLAKNELGMSEKKEVEVRGEIRFVDGVSRNDAERADPRELARTNRLIEKRIDGTTDDPDSRRA
jgi:hypothetical protein